MYPFHMSQVPYAPMHYPTFAPHMEPEPVRSPSTYEPWTSDGSYGYPYPGQCHGCCNHNYFPGHFTMRPPYPHLPPPSSHGYPAVPGTYPVQYIPPHYMMELPRYEYNNMPRDHHCCGCLNHKCNQKEGRNVKIEEAEPDQVELKRNEPKLPYEIKNYPYPIVWLPPGYMKGKEKRDSDSPSRGSKANESSKASEEPTIARNGEWFPFDVNNLRFLDSDRKGQDRSSSHGEKVYENSKASQEPQNAWNGEWLPFDANNFQSLKQGEDPKGNQHSDVEKQRQCPFPIFWMPYKPEVTVREEPKEMVIKQEPPKNLESAPVKLNNTEAKQEGNTKDEGTKLADKNIVLKTIPVKQVEQSEEKKTSADAEEKSGGKKSSLKSIPVKQVEQNEEKKIIADAEERGKKSVEESPKRRTSSPQKPSKLPPVCLRIDPLQKKKGSNGNSRSPSPPGDKGRSCYESGKNSEATVPSVMKESAKPDSSPTDGTATSKVETVKVSEEKITDGCVIVESANAEESMTQTMENSGEGREDKAGNDVKEKISEENHEYEARASDSREISEAKETLGDDGKKPGRTKLSDAEAAVIIQSAFRGFEVRKWEPLKKLKQLAEIKEQTGGIKNHIQALESSSDPSSNEKQRTIITEMIMSLLLKLDTIQGVHPSIRDIRKSVAKELVSLQESLDLLANKNLNECFEHSSSTSSEKTMSEEIEENLGTDGQNQEDNIGTEREPESLSAELCQNESLCVEDMTSNSKDVEISESVIVNGNIDEEIGKLSVVSSETRLEPTMEIETEDNQEIGDSSAGAEAPPNNHGGELGKTFESQQVGDGEKTTSAAGTTDYVSTGEAKDAQEVMELPQGAIEGYLDFEMAGEHEKSESRDNEVSENVVIKEINVAPENDEVKDLNRAEVLHEEGEKEQVLSNVEDDLGGEEKEMTCPEVLWEVFPAELPETDTEVGLEKAEEGVNLNEVEIGANEELGIVSQADEPSSAEEEKTPLVGNEMQDVPHDHHDHGVTNPDFLFGSEDNKPMHTACEAPVELGKEQSLQVEKNYLEEALEYQDKGQSTGDRQEEFDDEESVSVNAIPVEEGEIEPKPIMVNSEMGGYSCDSATAQYEEVDRKEANEMDIPPPSPTASEITHASDIMTESDKKLMEENEKLRQMMEKLLEAGNKQLNTISCLSGRVKDLEKRLSRKKKLKIGRPRTPATGSSCLKAKNYSSNERAVGLAM